METGGSSSPIPGLTPGVSIECVSTPLGLHGAYAVFARWQREQNISGGQETPKLRASRRAGEGSRRRFLEIHQEFTRRAAGKAGEWADYLRLKKSDRDDAREDIDK